MLLAHANQPVPDLAAIAADVPASVVAVVRRMLDKSPEARPKDGDSAASELRAAIAGAGAPGASSPTPAARPPATSRSLGWLIAGAAALAIAVLVIALTRDPGAPRDPAPAASSPPMASTAEAPRTADPWQSPTRASFVFCGDALAAVAGGIEGALVDARLLLVERAQLEQVLLKEIDLATGERVVDTRTAVKAGQLIGGHVSLLVRPAGEQVSLRAVIIQTSEMAGSEVVAPGDAAKRALALTQRALALVPVQCRLANDGSVWRLSAGRHHGVAVGDRFTIHGGTVQDPGSPTAVATVETVDAVTATATLAGPAPSALPALAKRTAP
ncbi:MAG: hypothetical protein H0V44_12935 [Planctomycetes bacterium]|nr:hypothetical protein [Planctomycetota bacterium]